VASSSSNQDIFDVRRIRRLVELMKEHDLTEINISQDETSIQLRRGGTPVAAPVAIAPAPAAPAAAPAPVAAPAAEPAGDGPNIDYVKSPIVGTFYAASDPESPPFIKVGDPIGVDSTVCIIEAMKVFNEIPAEISGKVVSVMVKNGDPVEFGQPLFKVDTQQ
jgi:acetyl-CoA carboxylase biotin carboxyl carrier protein